MELSDALLGLTPQALAELIGTAAALRFQLEAALRAAESDGERLERVAALAALSNAYAAAGAALQRLAAGMTSDEQRRVFDALDSTRRQRERAGLGDLNGPTRQPRP